MLHAITVLLVFQLLGEVISQAFRLPVPGPVLGMALLFVTLATRVPLPGRLRETAHDMLQHLSLLFVPAGVGIMLHAHRVAQEWLAIALALVVSTVLTIAVTALTVKAVGRLVRAHSQGSE